jgi:hypothetical protein
MAELMLDKSPIGPGRRILSALIVAAALCAFNAAVLAKPPTPAEIEEAYTYALPVFEIQRARYMGTTARPADRSALNHLMHRRNLSTHENRTVTTPNNDTLYSQAFLDLSGTAIDITTPDFGDRYFSLAFMDVYSNNFAIVGSRSTGTKPQHFFVVGPDWKGTAPAGASLIRAPGNLVWMLVRILIQGPEELTEVQHLQDGISLTAVTAFKPRDLLEPKPNDVASFIAVVNQALLLNPPPRADARELKRIRGTGIGPGLPVPEKEVLDAWQAEFPNLKERLFDSFVKQQPLTIINGWNYRTKDLGDFGTDYAFRAVVAIVGLAALTPEEAIYTNLMTDKDGQPLDSAQHYRWRIPPGGLPVKAFWSLTAYEETPDHALYFADNPIHRYAIGDRTRGLVKNDDGSIDILIQHEAPTGPLAANWLPIPTGPVKLTLRAYVPRDELLQGRYRYPGIERVP